MAGEGAEFAGVSPGPDGLPALPPEAVAAAQATNWRMVLMVVAATAAIVGAFMGWGPDVPARERGAYQLGCVVAVAAFVGAAAWEVRSRWAGR